MDRSGLPLSRGVRYHSLVGEYVITHWLMVLIKGRQILVSFIIVCIFLQCMTLLPAPGMYRSHSTADIQKIKRV